MCGITGIYRHSGINIDELHQMNLIIRHRGPDDEGYFIAADLKKTDILGGVDTDIGVLNSNLNYAPKNLIQNFESKDNYKIGLAHRRLSILDLSPKGHMPMCDHDGRYWITYNGEVYNFLEIRAELEESGVQFNSDSDTEVIVVAYKHWGVQCLNKFVGMFSFVIYDLEKDELFFARDRFGIKPLYYWISPDKSLYFGSEIKQFTVCESWRSVLNHQRAYDFLYYSLTDHTDETLFQGVYQIKPGYACTINLKQFDQSGGTKLTTFKWYNPTIARFEGSFEEAKDQFQKLLINSIDLHLRADVPVGSALSGGLDSSSIVCIVNKLLKEKESKEVQSTFSSVHENEKYSEKYWMDEVISHTTVKPHFVYPKYEELIETLPSLIWHMDEPYQSQSAFLAYQVFSRVKKEDIKVILNGQGADEYLSGYGDFKNLRLKKFIDNFKFRKFKDELELSTIKAFGASIRIVALHIYDSIGGSLRFYLASKSNNSKILSNIIDPNVLKINKYHPKDSFKYNNNTHIGISSYQLFSNPLPRYLKWEDRNSMAHSIEARVPFLDHRLIEFCYSLPLEYLDAKESPKRLLSESMEGILPDKIKNRKDKKGYITPEEEWVRHENTAEFRKLLEESINNSKGIINCSALDYFDDIVNGKTPFDYTYWRLILFGIWMKEFKLALK